MQTRKERFTRTHSGFFKQIQKIVIALSTITLLAGFTTAHGDAHAKKAKVLTDANIAAIVVGANKIDISAGQIALKRSKNPEVRKFAQRMIVDHRGVLNSAVELVTKLGVTPVDNELVATLAKQSREHEAKLKTLTGDAFDKRYIDHEVAYHEAVIGVIEKQLIPAAKNKELKNTLVSVVPAFKAHLKHCQMIQKKI